MCWAGVETEPASTQQRVVHSIAPTQQRIPCEICSTGKEVNAVLIVILVILVPRRRAKYELKHVVRTHLAANDAAFNCVVEQEDKEGTRGVTLSKELMAIAGTALGVTSIV